MFLWVSDDLTSILSEETHFLSFSEKKIWYFFRKKLKKIKQRKHWVLYEAWPYLILKWNAWIAIHRCPYKRNVPTSTQYKQTWIQQLNGTLYVHPKKVCGNHALESQKEWKTFWIANINPKVYVTDNHIIIHKPLITIHCLNCVFWSKREWVICTCSMYILFYLHEFCAVVRWI